MLWCAGNGSCVPPDCHSGPGGRTGGSDTPTGRKILLLECKLSLFFSLSWYLSGFSLTSGCNSVGFRFVLVFRFQPSLSGAVNLCPAPNLSLTNGSASDVFRVIDSSVYKNVKAREAFKPHACVQLLLQLSLSLSLSCSSIGNTWHALQNHAVKSFFYLLVATQYKTLVMLSQYL